LEEVNAFLLSSYLVPLHPPQINIKPLIFLLSVSKYRQPFQADGRGVLEQNKATAKIACSSSNIFTDKLLYSTSQQQLFVGMVEQNAFR
jgi:hypothetical protein